MAELVFLKLGGSLITDKTHAYTVRPDKLDELAGQIAAALDSRPGLTLILGHGSGSFGHTAAKEYQTRDGLNQSAALTTETRTVDEIRYWHGFAEVWFQAAQLNRFVMDALHRAKVPSLALAPVSAVTARDGKVSAWDRRALR